MKTIRPLVILCIATLLCAGCAATASSGSPNSHGASGSPTIDALVFDPASPLGPQMTAAIDADDAGIIAEILAAGYDPDTDLGAGATALHRAAAGNHADLIPILVAAGADLEARSTRRTPLMLAAVGAGGKTVTALLDAGANPTAGDRGFFGATALHIAAYNGNVEAIDALLAAGVDIDIKEGTQGTPLIYAAIRGQTEAVQHLVDLGADLTARDNSGLTALGWTDQAAHPAVAAILIAAGAPM